MKTQITILSLMFMATTVFAETKSMTGAALWSRPIEDQEITTYTKLLKDLNSLDQYNCYRNISNYGAPYDQQALQRYHTFTETKTGDLYIRATLGSTFQSVSETIPKDAQIKKISENEYMIEYRKDFELLYFKGATMESEKAGNGIVQHVFKSLNGQIQYRYSMHNLLTLVEKAIAPRPHIRCVAFEPMQEKIFGFWNTVRLMPIPIPDLKLKGNGCRGGSNTCTQIPGIPIAKFP